MIAALITILFFLLNIGSSTAFNAVFFLQLSSLMLIYIISIICVLYRHLVHPEQLLPARWRLSLFGPWINTGGIIYSMFVFFWCFWPGSTPPTLKIFNWSIVIFTRLLVSSGLTYFWKGRRSYPSPVVSVKTATCFGSASETKELALE